MYSFSSFEKPSNASPADGIITSGAEARVSGDAQNVLSASEQLKGGKRNKSRKNRTLRRKGGKKNVGGKRKSAKKSRSRK
jgi:hypothetical protein